MLAAGPTRIAAATASLQPTQLHTPATLGEWSFNEILAHLRACADMWGSAINSIIAHDHPTIRAINPRTWIDKTDYREQEFGPSLHAFSTQREELLAQLHVLAPADWQRSATITGAGKPFERSIHAYVEWLATHERSHINAIERLAALRRSRI